MATNQKSLMGSIGSMVGTKIHAMIQGKVAEVLPDLIEKEVDAQVAQYLSGAGVQVLVDRKLETHGTTHGKQPLGRPTSQRVCAVVGCIEKHRSKGYCAAHYQAARKHKWPMPAPTSFHIPASYRGQVQRSATK